MKYRLLSSTKALVITSAGTQIVCTYYEGAMAAQKALETMGAVRETLADRLRQDAQLKSLTVWGVNTGGNRSEVLVPGVKRIGKVTLTPLTTLDDLSIPPAARRLALARELHTVAVALQEYSPTC